MTMPLGFEMGKKKAQRQSLCAVVSRDCVVDFASSVSCSVRLAVILDLSLSLKADLKLDSDLEFLQRTSFEVEPK